MTIMFHSFSLFLFIYLSVCLFLFYFFPSRIAENAILNLVNLLGKDSFDIIHVPGVSLVINERVGANGGRVLKIECGDMLLVDHIHLADIIMMETDLPPVIYSYFYHLYIYIFLNLSYDNLC